MSNNVSQLKSHTKDELVRGLQLDSSSPERSATVTPIRQRPAGSLPPEMNVVCKDGERTQHLTKLAGTLIDRKSVV